MEFHDLVILKKCKFVGSLLLSVDVVVNVVMHFNMIWVIQKMIQGIVYPGNPSLQKKTGSTPRFKNSNTCLCSKIIVVAIDLFNQFIIARGPKKFVIDCKDRTLTKKNASHPAELVLHFPRSLATSLLVAVAFFSKQNRAETRPNWAQLASWDSCDFPFRVVKNTQIKLDHLPPKGIRKLWETQYKGGNKHHLKKEEVEEEEQQQQQPNNNNEDLWFEALKILETFHEALLWKRRQIHGFRLVGKSTPGSQFSPSGGIAHLGRNMVANNNGWWLLKVEVVASYNHIIIYCDCMILYKYFKGT